MSDVSSFYFALDIIWMNISGILVLFMGAGFAMLEAGSISAGNTVKILAKNLLDKFSTAFAWWIIGYGVAYGDEGNGFISNNVFTFHGSDSNVFRDWFFQWGFCFAAGTISGGAMAERVNIKGFLVYTMINAAFIYPVVAHWVWNPDGWLSQGWSSVSFVDLAGSGVVHMVGGVAAISGVYVIGPRKGSSGISHNVPLLVLGTIILWVGWYGFNGGSVRITSEDSLRQIGKVSENNTLSAMAAGLVAVALNFKSSKKIDILAACNGALAGLVSITGSCHVLEPWAAFVVGIIGGSVYWAFALLEVKLGFDDAVEAGAVHGACGLWGIVSAGFFHPESGLFYGNNGSLLGIQLVGSIVIFVWAAFWSGLIFWCLKRFGLLRLPDTEERQVCGHDISEFGLAAYQLHPSAMQTDKL